MEKERLQGPGKKKLTSKSIFVHSACGAAFVLPRDLAHELVAGGEEGNSEEGEEERGGAADVPGAEDDAEVSCVPCEEHLWGGS